MYFSINSVPILSTAGLCAILAAIMHIACIFGGPDWYRFFGAGEQIARAVEQGRWFPHVMAAAIAILLLIAAMFASVGSAAVAGRVGSVLPFTRTALTIVSAVLIARGLLIFAPQMWRPDLSPGFKFWSSAIVLVMGLLFAAGTVQAWHPLGAKVEQV